MKKYGFLIKPWLRLFLMLNGIGCIAGCAIAKERATTPAHAYYIIILLPPGEEEGKVYEALSDLSCIVYMDGNIVNVIPTGQMRQIVATVRLPDSTKLNAITTRLAAAGLLVRSIEPCATTATN